VPGRTGALLWLQVAAGIAALGGIYVAWTLYLQSPAALASVMRGAAAQAIHRFWFAGWGFDWLYDRLFVRPLLWLARVAARDGIDHIYGALAGAAGLGWRVLARTQTGRIRWYAAGLTAGALIVTTLVLLS